MARRAAASTVLHLRRFTTMLASLEVTTDQ